MEISELDSQDIDTDIDWRLAELKFGLRNEFSPLNIVVLKKE